MSAEICFDKSHIDDCLKAVAKQYRKLNKKGMPAEITLVGGASILINYGFRDSTYDVDAFIQASSSMKDAINFVTDTMELPNGWLNDDFRNTDSYTPRLTSFSKFYRTFSNVVTVRTITGEYLVAMKLKAFRKYKHDISDIVGILCAHAHAGNPLDFQQINQAVEDLYGGWQNMPEESLELIKRILSEADLDSLYRIYTQQEQNAKQALITFEEVYPQVLKEDNLDTILQHLLEKQK